MDLQNAARDLFVELAGARVSYLLVGGLALLSFVPGRNTQDIDLILSPNDLNCLSWNGVQLDRDFGKAVYRGIDVDLLFTDNPIFAHVALHERASLTFAGCEVPCASRAGLVMMKLFALPSLYRQGNLARAALYEADVRMPRKCIYGPHGSRIAKWAMAPRSNATAFSASSSTAEPIRAKSSACRPSS